MGWPDEIAWIKQFDHRPAPWQISIFNGEHARVDNEYAVRGNVRQGLTPPQSVIFCMGAEYRQCSAIRFALVVLGGSGPPWRNWNI